jgi:hypothetical protein
MSTAAFWIVSKSISATPGCSMSTRCGWNMHSGASKRSEPTLIVRPSGSYFDHIESIKYVIYRADR